MLTKQVQDFWKARFKRFIPKLNIKEASGCMFSCKIGQRGIVYYTSDHLAISL